MKRTRLKAVSDKRKAQMREYWKLRKQFLATHRLCQACGKALSREVHHKRGRYGLRLLDAKFWLAVCWNCHADIHEYPKLARERGYLYR